MDTGMTEEFRMFRTPSGGALAVARITDEFLPMQNPLP
jgi:hypothetical protein